MPCGGSGGRLGALAAVTLRLRQAVAGDAAAPDPGPTLAQVLESPYEVRAEELPAGWREPEWEAVAAGLPRVVSADSARALIGCPNRAAAEAVATAIQRRGGLGRHRSAAGGGDAAIRSVGAAQRRPGPRAAACLTGPGAANTTAGGSRTVPTPAGGSGARLYWQPSGRGAAR